MTTGKHTRHTCFFKLVSHSLFLIFLITGFPLASHGYDILMGVGEDGTFSHFAGRTICRLINMDPELTCNAVLAPDHTHNLTNLRSGALDVALVDSKMLYDALNNSGYFEFLDISYDNLRSLASIYDVPVVLVVRDDAMVTNLDGLEGKRINAGAPLSPQHLATDTIMQAKGWNKRNFRMVEELPATLSQDKLAFSNGAVQAMLHLGVHPDMELQRFIERTKASLVDMADPEIKKFVSDNSAFKMLTIPAATYSTNPGKIDTFGTQMILVTSEDLDDETARAIVTAVFQNKDKLQKVHPSFSAIKKSHIRKLNGEIQPHRAVMGDVE